MFTPEQPDLNWRDPEVARVLRAGAAVLARPRASTASASTSPPACFKHPGLPDSPDPDADERTRDSVNPLAWNQPEVHERVAPLAGGVRGVRGARRPRAAPGRRGLACPTAREHAQYVRPDELHQAFFFDLLGAPWDAEALPRRPSPRPARHRRGTGSTVTWVLNNHDQVRTVTRYGGGAPGVGGDVGLGAARARAAALLMLALPGAAYIYQGEELGLPEVVDLPDDVLTDPIFRRTGSRARMPRRLPGAAALVRRTPRRSASPRRGGARPWLPQPDWFAEHATDRALADTRSFWHLYREALQLRRRAAAARRGPAALAGRAARTSWPSSAATGWSARSTSAPSPCPPRSRGTPLLSSGPCPAGVLPGATAAWWIGD